MRINWPAWICSRTRVAMRRGTKPCLFSSHVDRGLIVTTISLLSQLVSPVRKARTVLPVVLSISNESPLDYLYDPESLKSE